MATTAVVSSLGAYNGVETWVNEVAAQTRPNAVVLVDGSDRQRDELVAMLVKQGVLTKLAGRFTGSYLARSDPRDVARVIEDTHICSVEDSGPLTNWWDPTEAHAVLGRHLKGIMRGRTMYVVPFSMGPIGSKLSRICVQVTDSPYVVLNMLIMARVGQKVLDYLGNGGGFVKAIHSVGVPLGPGQADMAWPCNPDIRKICHFPEEELIISIGSGYGGNALLGKKCLALRMESALAAADPEGAMAEHMMLVRVEQETTGRAWHIAAAFPSACGKTNLAMLLPTISGYRVTTLGDDIVWMRAIDGSLRAINPEAGFFGVAPGTGPKTNPVAVKAIMKGSLLTNVAYDEATGEAWWPGLTDEPPDRLISWTGEVWTKGSGIPAETTAHANSRFTTPYTNCYTGDLNTWNDPDGVPVDAILFGSRRPDTIPLVRVARSWAEGVLFGAMMSSARTAAAEGKVGEMTHDPFAMGPFFGLDVARKYIPNWLRMRRFIPEANQPVICYVNWFRQDGNRWLWPGFGENSRVIDLIIRYLEGKVELRNTPIGLLPSPDDFNLDGLEISAADMEALTELDSQAWIAEVEEVTRYVEQTFEGAFPLELSARLTDIRLELMAQA